LDGEDDDNDDDDDDNNNNNNNNGNNNFSVRLRSLRQTRYPNAAYEKNIRLIQKV